MHILTAVHREGPSPEAEHSPRGRVFLPTWTVAAVGEHRDLGCGLVACRRSKVGRAETHGLWYVLLGYLYKFSAKIELMTKNVWV